jgi:hypothetical protein
MSNQTYDSKAARNTGKVPPHCKWQTEQCSDGRTPAHRKHNIAKHPGSNPTGIIPHTNARQQQHGRQSE